MNKDYIVTKSNKLINASYNLSLQEQKIILTLSSMVQPKDEEFKEYEFKINDFIKLLDIKDQSKYKEVPRITKELMKKVIEIREGKDILQLSWLCSARYKTNEGKIILKIAPDLKPYMLKLKEFYTTYKLENILSLKSKYSIRLYEILRSYLFKKQVEITIDDLRNMIGANTKSYNTYNNFKNRVLNKSKDEIKQKTDISFEFEEIKTGRKVTSIKFYICSNKKIDKTQAEKEVCASIVEDPGEKDLIKSVQAIFDEQITQSEAKKILDKSNGELHIIKEKYSIAKSTPNIKNVVAWILKAIEEDYKIPKGKVKKSSFNDFEQRNYDFKELEKKLLGWSNVEESNEEYTENFNNQTNEEEIDKITEQIKKLADLKDLGILTDEEFENKKKMLLAKIK